MIHSKANQPFIFPWEGDVAPAQIDRLQDLSGDITISKDKVYEIGRDGILGYKKNTPSLKYTAKQFEYGSMDFWYKLAGVPKPASDGLDQSIDLDDIKANFFDVTAKLTDEDNALTFRGTIWFPKMRVNGVAINIGDPDAIIERSFDLVGEDYKILLGKHFAYATATSGGSEDTAVSLTPNAIEYASGKYILRVLRIRAGEVTEIEEGAGADEYVGTASTCTVADCLLGDIIKVYYMASSASTVPAWTDNDTDVDYLQAKNCEIYLKVGTGDDQRVYRLQSVGMDISFDRTDWKEIGNLEVVQTGVKSKTVKVTFNRFMEDFTVEEVLAGKDPASLDYPYIDTRNLADNVTLTIKIFAEETHDTFLMGYKITDLTTTAISSAQAVEDYQKQNTTMESDNLMITPDSSEL